MKYISFLLFLVFLLFAGWQYNDPDPVLWIPIYGIAAYCAWQSFKGQSNDEMLIVLTVISFAAAINSWSQMTAWEGVVTEGLSMKTVNQELARESLGLGICSVSFLFFFLVKKIKT
ncbi:MAG: transmembrane 220 family protein [Bacteroidota bacterium]